MPLGVDINNLIDDLRILSWEASEILLHYSRMMKNGNFKKDILENNNHEDPVTLADLKVNELIIKRISENYKGVDWDILSEENAKLSNFVFNSEWTWVLDPLDGTKDFIQGTKNYAMHLALHYQKKPFIGIVLIPENDELWISVGEKIWCEKRDGSKSLFDLSRNSELRNMTVVMSKNHSNKDLNNLIKEINFEKVKVMGSIGCKIASIVKGESDIYISLSLPGKNSPKDWDFAAPEVILRAAGGCITNIENEDLSYFQKGFKQQGIIIASNNRQKHGHICLQIKELIKKNDLFPLNY